MKISTKGRYALEAMLYLACHAKNEPVNIRRVAEHTGISEKYLEQLFFALRKKGIIDTMRGPKGGYFIARDIESISAGDVIRAVEGELVPVPCVKDPAECNFRLTETCVTRTLWENIAAALDSVLNNVSLKALAEDYHSHSGENNPNPEYFI